MAKTVSLNEYTYSSVAVLAGKLTVIAGKPISMGMAIQLAASMLDFIATMPQSVPALKRIVSESVSPEEFEEQMEEFYKTIALSRES